jgi:hypothetical protein
VLNLKGDAMSIDDFAKKTVSQFNKKITNEIFLLIQNDHKLMKEYLVLVGKHGHHAVNMRIGKVVKKQYQLNNKDREKNPTSTLISSHQRF